MAWLERRSKQAAGEMTTSARAARLDEAIRRASLRLEQEGVHVNILREGGVQQSFARIRLARRTAALDRLKARRAGSIGMSARDKATQDRSK